MLGLVLLELCELVFAEQRKARIIILRQLVVDPAEVPFAYHRQNLLVGIPPLEGQKSNFYISRMIVFKAVEEEDYVKY